MCSTTFCPPYLGVGVCERLVNHIIEKTEIKRKSGCFKIANNDLFKPLTKNNPKYINPKIIKERLTLETLRLSRKYFITSIICTLAASRN